MTSAGHDSGWHVAGAVAWGAEPALRAHPLQVLLTGINSPDHAAMFGQLAAHINATVTRNVVRACGGLVTGARWVIGMPH